MSLFNGWSPGWLARAQLLNQTRKSVVYLFVEKLLNPKTVKRETSNSAAKLPLTTASLFCSLTIDICCWFSICSAFFLSKKTTLSTVPLDQIKRLSRQWFRASVTRFGEISPLWQKFTGLWQKCSFLFGKMLSLLFSVPNGQILKNNQTIWSHSSSPNKSYRCLNLFLNKEKKSFCQF